MLMFRVKVFKLKNIFNKFLTQILIDLTFNLISNMIIIHVLIYFISNY